MCGWGNTCFPHDMAYGNITICLLCVPAKGHIQTIPCQRGIQIQEVEGSFSYCLLLWGHTPRSGQVEGGVAEWLISYSPFLFVTYFKILEIVHVSGPDK